MKVAWEREAANDATRAELRGWLLLALGALAVAGVLALALAASRTPGVQDHLPWGADFFHRGLVTHVVFSFQVWLLAMLGALGASATGARPAGWAGLGLATAGCVLLLVPAIGGAGEAALNNYVPVLVHPLFFTGLALLAAGVAIASSRNLVGPDGLRAAAVGLLAALACFAFAAWLIPAGTDADHAVERLFWGGGHVLQFVNTALLLVGWQTLARHVWGRGAVPPLLARAAFAALAVGAVVGIAGYRLDVLGLPHRQAFTQLLWVGLPLPPMALGAVVAWRLVRGLRPWGSPAFVALVLSLAVFGLGGAAGFGLGVADTRTPSHYHAVIGAVNLALMGVIHAELLPLLRRGGGGTGWVRAQLLLYGGGQTVHALGFYLAGLAGVARKTAGADQGLDNALKLASMGAVGLGGAVAVLGGVIFVVQVLKRLLRREVGHG